jgi:hypothetical protein
MMYVDEASSSEALRLTLVRGGYLPSSINLTLAGTWSPAAPPTNCRLMPARPEDLEEWSALYSRGFGRTGHDAAIDLLRMRLAFQHGPPVQHWFFVRGTSSIGICQTCSGPVVGIYSFTLCPRERGVGNVHTALQALRTKLTEAGEQAVYFEVLSRNKSRWSTLRRRRNLTVVRKLMGYASRPGQQ